MQWYKCFNLVKDEMFHSTRQSRVEWNISSFTEWKYLFHCTNDKHSLFAFYNLYKDSKILNKFTRKTIEKWFQLKKNKMVREANISPHKQIIKDDDVKECISTE